MRLNELDLRIGEREMAIRHAREQGSTASLTRHEDELQWLIRERRRHEVRLVQLEDSKD